MATSVDQKMLRQTKFPVEFNQKVDMQKVNVEVMKKWIAGKISEILGSEDDVVIELCFNLLEGSRFPNIKVLQIQLTGFLEKDTATFCKELWTLCLSAQSNPQGVPKELLEAKKLELIQEKIATEKAAEIARRRQEHERARDRELEQVRRREHLGRSERGRGRGRDVMAARSSRGFETRAQRDSRSPPPGPRNSKDHRFPSARREVDTYIPPSGPRMQERHRRRSRSVSYSPPRSPSRTSPRRRQRRSRTRSSSRSVVPQKSRSQISMRITEEERHKHWSSSERRNGENRSKDRGRPGSADRSISPSPRTNPHGKRSTSATSRSSSPSHRNKRKHDRQHRISRPRSESLSSRSPPLHRRGSGTRGERRRSLRDPIHDTNAISDMRNNESNTQLHVHNQESHSSRNSSQSPKRNLKRHRSIERYDPRFKRRRNTSSVELDDVNEERSKATAMRDDGE